MVPATSGGISSPRARSASSRPRPTGSSRASIPCRATTKSSSRCRSDGPSRQATTGRKFSATEQAMSTRLDNARTIRAPRGRELSAKSWLTEAPLRMLMNNLDPDVAEKPHELVVYGGIGRAARDWESFDRMVAALRTLEVDETLCVQSGKPVGVFRTHADAPRVLTANPTLVPPWATLDHFNELDPKGLTMYGHMTTG